MIEKTEGIVLRSHPFSRTSRMVTWLTPAFGLVTTSIKGACRPKSLFLGQTDVGYRCELLFYRKDHGGSHIAREVTPLDFRQGLRSSWRAFAAADYACWLISQTCQPMLPSPDAYALINSTLGALGEPGCDPAAELVSFEFRLLDILGLSPSFEPCADCTIPPERRAGCRFLLSSGHLGCIRSLSVHHESPDSVSLSPQLVGALAEAQANALNWRHDFKAPDDELALGVRRFLGLFIASHLDLPMHQRTAAFAWLDHRKADSREQ